MKSIDSNWKSRPENELLLCCAGVEPEVVRSIRIRDLLRQEIDWPCLEALALRHGVVSLLYKGLKSVDSESIPEAVLEALRRYYLVQVRNNLVLTNELLGLLRIFEEHKISAVPYKGPTLAAWVYGDPTLRPFCDLDLMIGPEDLTNAKEVIGSLGYQPKFPIPDDKLTTYMRSHYEFALVNKERGSMVELKWNIAERYLSFPIDAGRLWKRLRPVPLDGRNVLTFSPEDMLLICCIHGTKHLWTQLLWVCDVARLVHTQPKLDWEWVMEEADRLSARRILFLGLLLSKDLLEVSLPASVEERVGSDPAVKRLADAATARLFDSGLPAPGVWETTRFQLKARERLKDRVTHCYRLAAGVTPEDWMARPLPDFLFPLYYVIRPVRLIWKYGLKTLRRMWYGHNGLTRDETSRLMV
jgi:hypothetical protein